MAKREFPIHMVVREGHAEVVQLPLQAGADPSQSRYTYVGRLRAFTKCLGGLGCALILSRACVVGRSYVCTT